MIETDKVRVDLITSTVSNLLKGCLPEQIDHANQENDEIKQLSVYINRLLEQENELYEALMKLSHGELDMEINSNLPSAHGLKNLQASLKHLTWQTHQIAMGDFSQHTSFPGDFSKTFNWMVEHLEEYRQETDQALKDSEDRYKVLFESAGDGIYIHDFEGNILDVNEVQCSRLGYTREEYLKLNMKDIIPPEITHLFPAKFEELKKSGHMVVESVHVRRDGTRFPIETSSSIINYRGVTAILAFIRDISDRKRTEEERNRLQTQLLKAQKMEAIGTLAGGVAHDLNNILSGIVSYPELLLMQLPEDDPLRKPILTIHESGQKAATIVQDLLTLTRRGVSVPAVTDLNQVISEYLNGPEHKTLESFHPGVIIETDLESNLLYILGSQAHLSKAVKNLISNGIEAMPDGGTLSIKSENRYIDRPIQGYDDVDEGDYAVLSISDTGIGIPPEDFERIFEPFCTKKIMGRSGTGRGMAVVWRTIKDHKGYLDVKSIQEKGTTFTLYFPATREELIGRGTQYLKKPYTIKELGLAVHSELKK
jgi:PAS domain S-box-containing protein